MQIVWVVGGWVHVCLVHVCRYLPVPTYAYLRLPEEPRTACADCTHHPRVTVEGQGGHGGCAARPAQVKPPQPVIERIERHHCRSGMECALNVAAVAIHSPILDCSMLRYAPFSTQRCIYVMDELRQYMRTSALGAGARKKRELDSLGRMYATGRRKTSVARVWVSEGEGRLRVNGTSGAQYFARVWVREKREYRPSFSIPLFFNRLGFRAWLLV